MQEIISVPEKGKKKKGRKLRKTKNILQAADLFHLP